MEAKTKKLNPVFDDLNNPDTILNHVEHLIKKTEATPHAEILQHLIEQFEQLDFETLAFPQAKTLKKKLENPKLSADQRKEINKQLDKLILPTNIYWFCQLKMP